MTSFLAFSTPSVRPLRRARSAPRRQCPRCAQSRDGSTSRSEAAQLPTLGDVPQPESVVLRGIAHDLELLAVSQSLSADPELRAHIALLRRHKVALLMDDVACHIRCASPAPVSATLADIASRADALGAALLALPPDADDSSLRAALRGLLWEARVALEPLAPAPWTRAALERARGALLDVARHPAVQPPPASSALRAEVYALLVENTLLEELQSLRVLERAVRDAVARAALQSSSLNDAYCDAAVAMLMRAAASLGIDDYRVRGKRRLADAVQAVREAMRMTSNAVPEGVEQACGRLHGVLLESLATDLAARRPAGQAMLLRPAMHDIPNFEVVTTHMLRGGQPTPQGMGWLLDYGVDTVVDLRGSDRANQWLGPHFWSMGEVEEAGDDLVTGGVQGLTLRNVGIEDFGTPSLEQVEEFIEIMNSVRNDGGVCFVHCKAGIGRTGVMVSCWRIYEGESADEALRKERLYSPDGGGLRQEEFVRNYASWCANRW